MLNGVVYVHCGACGTELPITERQYMAWNLAPCDVCPEGADLVHARAHSDLPGDDY